MKTLNSTINALERLNCKMEKSLGLSTLGLSTLGWAAGFRTALWYAIDILEEELNRKPERITGA